MYVISCSLVKLLKAKTPNPPSHPALWKEAALQAEGGRVLAEAGLLLPQTGLGVQRSELALQGTAGALSLYPIT